MRRVSSSKDSSSTCPALIAPDPPHIPSRLICLSLAERHDLRAHDACTRAQRHHVAHQRLRLALHREHARDLHTSWTPAEACVFGE